MKKIILLSVLLTLSSIQLFAQTPSAYSVFNIGLKNELFSTRSVGLSMGAITIDDPDYLNQSNPAAMTNLELTKIEVFANGNSTFISDKLNTKQIKSFEVGGLALAFPLSKSNGVSLLLGVSPYTKSNFKVSSQQYINPEFGTGTTEIDVIGGLNDLHIASSWNAFYGIHIGAAYHYLFGNSKFVTKTSFSNTFFDYSEFTRSYEDRGSYYAVGLIFPQFNLGDISDIKFGLTLDTKALIKSDYFADRKSSAVDDTTEKVSSDYNIPAKITAGLSFRFLSDYRGMVEYSSQEWDSYNNLSKMNIDAYKRFSGAVEYRPYKETNFDFSKAVYRIGFSFEQLPLYINSQNINQTTLSIGASYPISYQNHIDLGLAFGTRGETTNGNLKEKFVRFSLGLSLGELWFTQQDR